jgi:diguanylate cyclase (GGDEF)-like protein
MNISIVEDDPNMRILLQNYLESITDRDRKTFSESENFLDWLDDRDDGAKRAIDLILMDIQLPGINGITTTRQLKDDPLLENLPVLAITGYDDLEKLEEAFNAGCTDYLTKPLNKIEFRARVESALRLKDALDRERELANRDALTELYNRRFFNEQIKKEYDRAHRQNHELALILCDIDYFKQYNDTYGHTSGDEALKNVADVLKTSLRRPGDFVARYGGEEFAVLLPNTDQEGAMNRAEKIRKDVQNLEIEHSNSTVSEVLTLSLGASSQVPTSSGSPLDLINTADQALYRAKDEGRNRSTFKARLDSQPR